MKIKARINSDNVGSIDIYPYVTAKGNVDMFRDITVYKHFSLDDGKTLEAATISAPSPGQVSPASAHLFGAALVKAAEIAVGWDLTDGRNQMLEWLAGEAEAITPDEQRAYEREKKAEQRARERRRAAAAAR